MTQMNELSLQEFQSPVRGNNAVILGMTHMRIISHRSTPNYECICKFLSQTVEKCRRSSCHTLFSSPTRSNNSIIFGTTWWNIKSRTFTLYHEHIFKISSKYVKKCRSSLHIKLNKGQYIDAWKWCHSNPHLITNAYAKFYLNPWRNAEVQVNIIYL